MSKILKTLGTIVVVIFVLLFVIIGVSFTNHKIQLSKENSIFIPNGEMLRVNGHKMHVYIEGEGSETLVFMSGGGTSSPVLDFKSLYSLLSNKHKIVVVEKAGYGFSEEADVDRDIDTILEETRQALSKAGLKAPYILFPHSMSGIEALYWAQEYPQEVKAIVGLDMAVPDAYKDYHINHFMINLSAFGSKIGITRFFPSIANDSAAIKYGTLTEEEKKLYKAVFYRRTLTNPMVSEVKEIKKNAQRVNQRNIPEIPMLFFISNGDGSGWDKDQWVEFQKTYSKNVSVSKSVKLNCSHYVHDIEYKKIAEESEQFIEEITKQDH